jgi:hypothetical protein
MQNMKSGHHEFGTLILSEIRKLIVHRATHSRGNASKFNINQKTTSLLMRPNKTIRDDTFPGQEQATPVPSGCVIKIFTNEWAGRTL